MKVNIQAVVNDLKNVKIENVIFEAITNAMQAEATNIKVDIRAVSLDMKEVKLHIDSIIISDNGVGFDEDNFKSFNTYRSDYKKSLGCKGIGRFVYLKHFEKVKVISRNIECIFDVQGTKQIPKEKETNETTQIELLYPKTKQYIDFEKIAEQIKEHFLAYFQMETKNITIEIYKNRDLLATINSRDIPKFKNKAFKIGNYDFSLSYIFGDKKLNNEGFYAANKRVVSKNSDLENEKKYNLFKDNELKIYFILESKYFNENVNSERNELLIYPKQKNTLQFHDLCWEDIHNELDIQLKEIYKENGFDIDKTIKENRKEAIKNFPYLGAYFDNSNELNIEQMQKNAKKEFENDKIFLRNENNKNDKDYEVKLSKVTQAELAEYVFDRNRLIQQLRESVKKGDIEEKIHNLFMSKNTFDDEQNYKTNNVWLFDDRFMGYDKIFSDIQIKNIFPELHQNIEKPDILSIISNSYEKEKINDILLIEFKRPEANRDYFPKANRQLQNYASLINQTDSAKKIRIWAYAFLKFSDEILKDLINDDYNQIYTQSSFPICYKYNKQNNVVINFMDYNSLICDAENRNKLFLDILQGKYLDNE